MCDFSGIICEIHGQKNVKNPRSARTGEICVMGEEVFLQRFKGQGLCLI